MCRTGSASSAAGPPSLITRNWSTNGCAWGLRVSPIAGTRLRSVCSAASVGAASQGVFVSAGSHGEVPILTGVAAVGLGARLLNQNRLRGRLFLNWFARSLRPVSSASRDLFLDNVDYIVLYDKWLPRLTDRTTFIRSRLVGEGAFSHYFAC